MYPPGLPSLLEGLLCQGAPVRREKACVSQGPPTRSRPPDAHPPSSLRCEKGSWGPSHLLPPHENKRGVLEDDRQLSTLEQAQVALLIL